MRAWLEAQRPLLVCHDAGGAEIVSSWARRNGRPATAAVVEGPARGIFARKLPQLQQQPAARLDECVRQADFVLAGSGWASSLERDAIAIAGEHGRRVAVFLDHWVNYEERFRTSRQIRLPDEIWVGDRYAEAMARACFPQTPVLLVGNPYFEDIREELQPLLAQRAVAPEVTRILYVTEPIVDHLAKGAQSVQYTEFDALAYALDKLRQRQARGDKLQIRVRLHPAEPAGKYDSVIARHSELPLETSSGNTLIQDCVWADQVAGCESMAMVVALLAGRRVYTSIPPGGRRCRLPHGEIEPL